MRVRLFISTRKMAIAQGKCVEGDAGTLNKYTRISVMCFTRERFRLLKTGFLPRDILCIAMRHG